MSSRLVRKPALAIACVLFLGCGSPSQSDDELVLGGPTGSEEVAPEIDVAPDADAGIDEPSREDTPLLDVCALDAQQTFIVAETFVSPTDSLSLTARHDGALLSWVAYQNGERRVSSMWMAGPSAREVTVEQAGEQRAPASAVTSTGYVSVIASEGEGGTVAVSKMISSAGESTAPARTLAEDVDADHGPVVATANDGSSLLVFQAAHGRPRGFTQQLSSAGEPVGAPQELSALQGSLGALSLAAFGDGYLLAWVDRSRHVQLLSLAADGAPVLGPVRADAEANAEGRLDLAVSDEGGAVAFDVLVAETRPEVRVRSFDTTLAFRAAERTLNGPDREAAMPRIAAFRGGFLVLYRSVRAGAAQLTLDVVGPRGDALASHALAELSDPTLPVVLRMTPDGRQLLFAWVDRVDISGAYELRRGEVSCE